MALQVGNLLKDYSANSFISLADANSYLAVEAGATSVKRWLDMPAAMQEASLIHVSRWMANTLEWCSSDLDAQELQLVGQAAARLAVAMSASGTLGDAYSNENSEAPVKRLKADTVEIEFAIPTDAADAATQWPWLYAMLRKLLCLNDGRRVLGLGVYVV